MSPSLKPGLQNNGEIVIDLERTSHDYYLLAPQDKKDIHHFIWTKSVGAAFFYGICSSIMAFINKAVVTSYGFDHPFFIMACQMAATIIFLELLRISQYISIPPYSLIQGHAFLWPTLFYAIHSVTALQALGGMSIPMYAAIKRCSPVVILILSVFVLRRPPPSFQICLSVVLITAGCLIAGIGDLSFDMSAYICGTVSVLAQGLYLTLVQQGGENNMSALQILQLNSFNTFPLFVAITFLTGEIYKVSRFQSLLDLGFLTCFILQVCTGVLLNYSLFLCTTLSSALTTSLVGVLKSVLQTFIGFFAFGGVKFHPLNVAGLVLNMYGGFLYTYAKYKEKQICISGGLSFEHSNHQPVIVTRQWQNC